MIQIYCQRSMKKKNKKGQKRRITITIKIWFKVQEKIKVKYVYKKSIQVLKRIYSNKNKLK